MFEDATSKLREAWLERMQRASHIQVQWKETIAHKQGAVRPAHLVEGTGNATPEVLKLGIPHKDIEFEDLTRSLKISGNMMRLESQSLSISDPMNLRYQDLVTSNNGEYSRSTVARFDGSSVNGIINHELRNMSARTVSLSAIMMCYRALNVDFVMSDDPVIERVESDGTFVVKLAKDRVWVDPNRNFFPVRLETYLKGQVIERVNIDSANSDGRWELAGWKYVKFDHHRKCESIAAIHEAELVRMTFETKSASDFELVFEEGVRVVQRRGSGKWISLGGGKLRPIPEE